MENKADFNITEKVLEELERNFRGMWICLASAIYDRGGTRGHAEQKALEQMDTFVQIKTRRENPLNESLKKINSKHRKVVSENIMKSEHSNDVFIKKCFGNELVGKRWAASADREFKLAMQKFNEFYAKYQPKQNDNKFELDTNKQRLLKMYIHMMHQKINDARDNKYKLTADEQHLIRMYIQMKNQKACEPRGY